jgi:probable F420-dependent oxidoreductase
VKHVRVAIQLHPQHGDYDQLRRAVYRAELLGADVVYNWDHFFPLYGDPGGRHFECWTMLGAWAEQTRRIELGALVTCNSYRNPELLADMARTVDHVSGGRLVLGIGSGWFRRDYEEYGYEFGTLGSRGRELARALPLIKERWEKLVPRPTRSIPIVIGGVGERVTLRLVAEQADVWHAMFPDRPEELVPKVSALERWCAEVGRDPRSIEWSVGVEPDDLGRFLAEDAEAYVELGFTQFTLGVTGPSWQLTSEVEDWLAWRDQRNAARRLGALASATP